MAASATIAHRIPGRVRLRVDERRGDAAYFSDLAQRLARFDNVAGVKANPVTGSIALRFGGSLAELLRRAQEENLLTLAEGIVDGAGARNAGRMAPAAPVNLVSGREINRDFMMGSMLLVVGLAQLFRGRWFPPAFSVLWYAREAFDLAGKRH